MASTARLARLRELVQADLRALPDRAPDPIASDSDASGGVPLDPVDLPSQPLMTEPDKFNPEQPTTPTADRPNTWRKDSQSANAPRLPSNPNPPARAPLPATNLNRGDLGSSTQYYAPVLALSRYPYKWCDKRHSQDIASAFFDQGKFWAREWDL